jgi:hypothetical protein
MGLNLVPRPAARIIAFLPGDGNTIFLWVISYSAINTQKYGKVIHFHASFLSLQDQELIEV